MVLSAAIVLPLILDGERPAELDIEVQVTTPPAFPIVEIAPVQPIDSLSVKSSSPEGKSPNEISLIPVPRPANDVKTIVKAEPAATKPEVKTVTKEPEKQTTIAADRWVVQIATFKSRDNATRLVEKLKGAKYDAYSTTTSSLHKVYVGPEFKRDTSEKIRNDIKKKFNLAGIVVKFSVN
ncbi:sporulation protein [Marinomonas ushuaiensis DSM 15871]|uniref:Sporulation protein n=2 Tax=Marinomonas TaxID=28253 RepID=X7E690_9GAMM|nr:sporulation protein [Marinomonas ushuaiensis DSM 15871]